MRIVTIIVKVAAARLTKIPVSDQVGFLSSWFAARSRPRNLIVPKNRRGRECLIWAMHPIKMCPHSLEFWAPEWALRRARGASLSRSPCLFRQRLCTYSPMSTKHRRLPRSFPRSNSPVARCVADRTHLTILSSRTKPKSKRAGTNLYLGVFAAGAIGQVRLRGGMSDV